MTFKIWRLGSSSRKYLLVHACVFIEQHSAYDAKLSVLLVWVFPSCGRSVMVTVAEISDQSTRDSLHALVSDSVISPDLPPRLHRYFAVSSASSPPLPALIVPTHGSRLPLDLQRARSRIETSSCGCWLPVTSHPLSQIYSSSPRLWSGFSAHPSFPMRSATLGACVVEELEIS